MKAHDLCHGHGSAIRDPSAAEIARIVTKHALHHDALDAFKRASQVVIADNQSVCCFDNPRHDNLQLRRQKRPALQENAQHEKPAGNQDWVGFW
jgi:hypothetical protein